MSAIERIFRLWHAESVQGQPGDHSPEARALVDELTARHKAWLDNPQKEDYRQAWNAVLPLVVELRAKGEDRSKGEVEVCLDALFGASLLMMQGKELSPGTRQAAGLMAEMLNMLDSAADEKSA